MINYAIYEKTTGRIFQWGQVIIDQYDIQESEEYGVIHPETFENLENFFILNEIFTQRPGMTILVDKTVVSVNETTVISNIPPNTRCDLRGNIYTIDDGVINFITDRPGIYEFKFECFPYLNTSLSIEVV